MTNLEERLIELGNKLARSIGHRMGHSCPKISPTIPCTCGAAQQQAQALNDWDQLMQRVKES